MAASHPERSGAMLIVVLCLIFLLSGAAGLLFELLWFRGAGLSFGNSVWASSITLAAYMGGLALGNALTARFGQRVRDPLRAYAVLELIIGGVGVALVALLPALAGVLAPLVGSVHEGPWWSAPLRLVLVFALMMVPTTAMGATLPLLVMALCRQRTGFGKALGYLYGFNTLGAMVGVAAGEAWLVPALGVRGTGVAAGLLNLLAAGLSLALLKGIGAGAAAPGPGPATAAAATAARWRVGVVALASGLCGAALLGAEVLWFRFLRLFFLDTDTTFAVMLAVVLAGIAIGGVLAGIALSRWPRRHDLALVLAGGCGAAFVASYALFDPRSAGDVWYVDGGSIATLSLLLMFPTSLMSGALFTFMGQALRSMARSDVGAAAALTAANTTGAMVGALAAAFVLLPGFGLERSMWALAVVWAVVVVALAAALAAPGASGRRPTQLAAVVLALGAVALFPHGRMQGHLDAAAEKFSRPEGSHRVALREGLTETLQYLRRDWLGQPLSYRMLTNGFSMSDSQPGSQRYMGLYAHWPAALHPRLESALLISYGLGNTAHSLTQLPSLRSIDVVDISRDVLAHSAVAYPGGLDPLRDPRVRVHVEDGRFFLQAGARRFDLITSEPPPPRAPGVVNLYTQEYFALIRSRLNPGGFATYWLPVHDMTAADARAILRGFCNAFADCALWAGHGLNWMMTGSRDAAPAPSAEHFGAQWGDPRLRRALQAIGLDTPAMLGATFMADARQLDALIGDAPPLTDDFPKRYSQRIPTDADQRLYAAWMDPRQCAERFRSSAWIARIWPASLREPSLDHFVVQPAVNAPEQVAQSGWRLQTIDAALQRPGLVTPVLWLLGTSWREVEIAQAASAQADPAVAYVLGVHALAESRAAEAADHLERAWRGGDRRALLPLLFSACRAGQSGRARAVAVAESLGEIANPHARCW